MSKYTSTTFKLKLTEDTGASAGMYENSILKFKIKDKKHYLASIHKTIKKAINDEYN